MKYPENKGHDSILSVSSRKFLGVAHLPAVQINMSYILWTKIFQAT